MTDPIERQAAIDALKTCQRHCIDPNDYYISAEDAEYRINALPSAQPEDKCGECDAWNQYKNYPRQQWILCSERLPEETVLVTVETKTFRHKYICEAVWIPRWTWKASFDNWEDCSEYNEDEDEFYVNEGWYERVHNWDEYSYVGIEDAVLAWMPLPEPWKGEKNG